MTHPEHPIRRWRSFLPIGAALALAACATATPYQPLGTRGSSGGFAEQRIEANRYRVVFSGNDYTSRQTVENYLLFRAAELTVASGYDGFTIVRHDTDKNVDVYQSPSYGRYGYWRPYWRYYGGSRYGWRSWDPWFGDPYWGDRVSIDTVERYEAMAEIIMYRGARTDPSSFDARQVIGNLQPTIVVPR